MKNLFLLSALIAGLSLIPAGRVTAQTFASVHSFAILTYNAACYANTNLDGSDLHGGLILSGNTLYGAAENGGDYGDGTVFSVNTNGTDFTVLHSFTAISIITGNNADGDEPFCALLLSGNTLYGTTRVGGLSDFGTVFSVNTNGSNFANLHNFSTPNYSDSGAETNTDGGQSYAGLILSGNTLYGTTSQYGWFGEGTVFAMNTSGSNFTTLYSFTQTDYDSVTGAYTNSDGAEPQGELILSGDTLYGTTPAGGTSGVGTVFSLKTNGTCFTNLYSFTGGSDGGHPEGGVVLSGNTLYGAAMSGGIYLSGTVFSVNTNGSNFATVYPLNNYLGDGEQPYGGLILSGNTLYGTATAGGASGKGTVFALNTNGMGYTNLHSFTSAIYDSDAGADTNSDGFTPFGTLILSGNTLYGTTDSGGTNGSGALFSLSLPGPPQLTIVRSGGNVILTWPTNASSFTLHSTTNLASTNWSAVSPAPVVVSGRNTVTNSITGTRQFYRLSQ